MTSAIGLTDACGAIADEVIGVSVAITVVLLP
jgi:hypothetical protein